MAKAVSAGDGTRPDSATTQDASQCSQHGLHGLTHQRRVPRVPDPGGRRQALEQGVRQGRHRCSRDVGATPGQMHCRRKAHAALRAACRHWPQAPEDRRPVRLVQVHPLSQSDPARRSWPAEPVPKHLLREAVDGQRQQEDSRPAAVGVTYVSRAPVRGDRGPERADYEEGLDEGLLSMHEKLKKGAGKVVDKIVKKMGTGETTVDS
mmetsp:Transcript_6096/g.12481  ORF Transcript_6096/g.12481 Transcript_6096/m.12481 type:complete len:207 (+) Transcript_6096:54-674(+)